MVRLLERTAHLAAAVHCRLRLRACSALRRREQGAAKGAAPELEPPRGVHESRVRAIRKCSDFAIRNALISCRPSWPRSHTQPNSRVRPCVRPPRGQTIIRLSHNLQRNCPTLRTKVLALEPSGLHADGSQARSGDQIGVASGSRHSQIHAPLHPLRSGVAIVSPMM